MSFFAGSRLLNLAFLTALLAVGAWSQTTSQVRIFAEPTDAYFFVDGVRYRSAQTFFWTTR
jgi:hypothetical protein